VNSWLTGSKLVSLPFSDHCEPLLTDPEAINLLLSGISRKSSDRFQYAEIRLRSVQLGSQVDSQFQSEHFLHVLDLTRSLEELYSNLHHNCIRRKILRADRERLVLDQGRSEVLLKEFYSLLLLTRRRHRLPPQPFAWFQNLVECFGPRLVIRVARLEGRPIAAILTLRHKQTIVYKYGCSNERYHKLGGMPRLFWQAIQEAKADKLHEFDLGRSDPANTGLIRFKDHLGATPSTVSYRHLFRSQDSSKDMLKSPLMRAILPHLPDGLFRLAGEILYRHAG